MNKGNVYPVPPLSDLTLAVRCSIIIVEHHRQGERSTG